MSHSILIKHTNKPNIAIIGAGSIGMLVYHQIVQKNLLTPYFVDTRKIHVPISKILRLEYKQKVHFSKANFYPTKAITSSDIVLITTKAYSVPQICKQIAPYLKPNTILIIMVNGIGVIEKVKQILPSHHFILGGSTSNGAMKNKNTCFLKGLGQTFIGEYRHHEVTQSSHLYNLETLNKFIKSINATYTHNVYDKILNKLSINAVINPLTAIKQIQNGELLNQENLELFNNLCSEITPILQQMGLKTTKEELAQNVKNVCQTTFKNYSSMEQDIAFNRKTEVDYILLPLIKTANDKNLSHSLIKELYKKIKNKLN